MSSRRMLSQEIQERFEREKQTPEELRKKTDWRDFLETCIRKDYPHLRLVLAGSSICEFAATGSDCDFTLLRNSYGFESDQTVLRGIERRLKSEYHRYNLQTEMISTAVVPILILKDYSRGLEGDISYNAPNTINSTFMMRCYGNMDSRVQPLVITIKSWAKKAGITNAKDHKLSGFAVVLLVIHYLQAGCSPAVVPSLQQQYPSYFSGTDVSTTADRLGSGYVPPVITSYSSRNSESIGDLLEGFFRYYARFSWSRVISVRTAGFIPLPYNKKWRNPKIRIEDPYNGTNVTRAVYQDWPFRKICGAFESAKNSLSSGGKLHEIF